MATVNQVLKTVVVFLVPALLTISSVHKHSPDDDKSWLRYWVVISLLSLLEIPLDRLNFMPGYSRIKMMLVGWCLIPGPLSGSNVIFKIVRIS